MADRLARIEARLEELHAKLDELLELVPARRHVTVPPPEEPVEISETDRAAARAAARRLGLVVRGE